MSDRIESGSLLGAHGTTAELHVRTCDNAERVVRVKRQPSSWPPERPSVRWKVVHEDPPRRIGYIHIIRFDDDAAPLIDSAMTHLSRTNGLVIDIRENTGGNLSYLRLVSFLVTDTGMVAALVSRPFLDRLGRAPPSLDSSMAAALPRVSGVYRTAGIIDAFRRNSGAASFYLEDAGARRYSQRVAVLTSERTGSAAEGFALTMRGRPGARLFGQRTAGALVGSERFGLPGGWSLTLPTHAGYGPDLKLYRDVAVEPDVTIPLTRDALCAGRDEALEAAFNWLDGTSDAAGMR